MHRGGTVGAVRHHSGHGTDHHAHRAAGAVRRPGAGGRARRPDRPLPPRRLGGPGATAGAGAPRRRPRRGQGGARAAARPDA